MHSEVCVARADIAGCDLETRSDKGTHFRGEDSRFLVCVRVIAQPGKSENIGRVAAREKRQEVHSDRRGDGGCLSAEHRGGLLDDAGNHRTSKDVPTLEA